MKGQRAVYAIVTAALLLWGAFALPALLPSSRAFAAAGETLLSSCTTYYSEENLGRAHNVELAAGRIAGTVLLPRASFSFNAAAGERSGENGYWEAPVIENGEYVMGIGGGVCQVSSTLFYAALEAGVRVSESHPHSLPVSYIPPSLDAMVSKWSDLKLFNCRAFPVRIEATAEDGVLTVRIFGTPDGLLYRAESEVLARIPPLEEDAEGFGGKEGIVSESYLSVFGEGGELISRTRIRRDVYSPRSYSPPQG